MNALLAILLWFAELATPGTALVDQQTTNFNPNETAGVHIINVNPRTVVALEDTHFKPEQ